jgi:hypothetical protein
MPRSGIAKQNIVMLSAPSGRSTVIGPKRRDVEHPEGGVRQSSTRSLLRTALLRNMRSDMQRGPSGRVTIKKNQKIQKKSKISKIFDFF